MKNRIHKIIEHSQLTATDFAKKIDIKKATVSHILSERNKPSLEVIQKILTTFSTLNSEWLLFGRGEMYKTKEESNVLFPNESFSDEETGNYENFKTPVNNDDTQKIIEKDNIQEIEEKQKSPNTEAKKYYEEVREQKHKKKKKKRKKHNKVEFNKKKESHSESKNISTRNNTERIILFSSDKTFTEYTPAK